MKYDRIGIVRKHQTARKGEELKTPVFQSETSTLKQFSLLEQFTIQNEQLKQLLSDFASLKDELVNATCAINE